MIAIVNVDKHPRETGWHLYALEINEKEICRFRHRREESLITILEQAKAALIRRELEAAQMLFEQTKRSSHGPTKT